MIEFKTPIGFWKPKFQIEKEVRELEADLILTISALDSITKSTALEALHTAERTLEILRSRNSHSFE